eukprot:gene40548-36450_t
MAEAAMRTQDSEWQQQDPARCDDEQWLRDVAYYFDQHGRRLCHLGAITEGAVWIAHSLRTHLLLSPVSALNNALVPTLAM